MKEFLQYGVPIVCAVIASWGTWQLRKQSKQKAKLKRILSECQRFYDLEDVYCEMLADLTWHKTPLAAKRWVRAVQRSRGQESPLITPRDVAREMARL